MKLQSAEATLSARLGRIEELLGALERRKPDDLPAVPAAGSGSPPPQSSPLSAGVDEDMEQVARMVKRSLVELVERSGERLALTLAKVQRVLEETSRVIPPDGAPWLASLSACVTDLAGVLRELGAEPFDAEDGEFFDPMIHQCIGEERYEARDSGLVVRSVCPGYRSPSGHIILPALVVVNRK